MKRFCLIPLCLTLCVPMPAQKAGSDRPPRVFLMDAETLLEQRRLDMAGHADALAAAVRQAADRAMKEGPFSVMDKQVSPPVATSTTT